MRYFYSLYFPSYSRIYYSFGESFPETSNEVE